MLLGGLHMTQAWVEAGMPATVLYLNKAVPNRAALCAEGERALDDWLRRCPDLVPQYPVTGIVLARR